MPVERSKPLISIICPVYNEIGFIDRLVKFIVSAHPDAKECIFADGGSTDGTLQVLQKYAMQYPDIIRVIHNPQKFVPHALNLAVRKCRADKICTINAHSLYAEDYFEQLLKTFTETGAGIVGGQTRSAGVTIIQRVTAKVLASALGSGNRKTRNEEFRGFTDYVRFGALKKEIFTAVGNFDEELIRNYDEEFFFRAKRNGFTIYSNPDIRLWHYPQKTISGVFRQYYQYGFFKPLVSFKEKSEIKLRHVIPALFATYLLTIPLCLLSKWYFLPLAVYFGLLLCFSVKLGKGFKETLLLPVIFATIHMAYGLGYMAGLPTAAAKKTPREKQ